MVRVNGESQDVAGRCLEEFLSSEGYMKERIVVEINYNIVPAEHYASTTLRDGDNVEIVRFVGGG